jgi:hypothetical protein
VAAPGGRGPVLAAVGAYAWVWMPTWNAERMSLGLVRLLRSHWFGGEALTHRMIDRVGASGQRSASSSTRKDVSRR